MPHISTKKLDQKLLERLFDKFISVLEQAQNKRSLPLLANELFTTTEKIMLAKRLAIILMLDSGIPQNKIVNTLGVSPSTVAISSLGIEVGKYNTILKISKKEKVDFEKIIWNILTVGGIMPPRAGKRYWLKIP